MRQTPNEECSTGEKKRKGSIFLTCQCHKRQKKNREMLTTKRDVTIICNT